MDQDMRKALLRHAKQYGVEGVLEHARELGWSRQELGDLLEALDALKPGSPVLPKTYKRRTLTTAQRIGRWFGDEEEEAAA